MTNAYEDVLFSAVEIGSLAQLSFGAWARSTLLGGFYELLDHTNDYALNPTWWLGVLLKTHVLVGNETVRTFAVTSNVPTLQAFVFKVGEKNVALMANLDTEAVEVTVELGGDKAAPRTE